MHAHALQVKLRKELSRNRTLLMEAGYISFNVIRLPIRRVEKWQCITVAEQLRVGSVGASAT